jgi:hypothetical protein
MEFECPDMKTSKYSVDFKMIILHPFLFYLDYLNYADCPCLLLEIPACLQVQHSSDSA